MQSQPNKPQPITDFAKSKARTLSLRIFIVGACSTFVVGLLFGLYYYHGQLFQTLGVVTKSLSQPVALGGDFLPTQVVKTLVKSGNFKDAWVTLPRGKVYVDAHQHRNYPKLGEVENKKYYWNKGMPHVLVAEAIEYNNDKVGMLYVGYQIPVLAIFSFATVVCVLFSIISLYLYLHMLRLARSVAIPFHEYSKELDENTDKEKFLESDHGLNRFIEILKFNTILLNYIKKSKANEALARKAISKAQIAKVAARVRHDVVASLVIGESVVERLDQKDRQVGLLKSVFERISNTVTDIPKIGSLTEAEMRLAAMGDSISSTEPEDKLCSCHISALIYQIVGEIKLSRLCEGKDIKFDVSCDSNGFASYCEVEPNKFKRDLINLYKNSVEAIESAGLVKTHVSVVDDSVSIIISDNGKGISPENLQKVGRRGVTIGKKNGTGIGLSSAIEDVSRWGGTLSIKSPDGKGVTVEILIPQAEENFLYPTSLAFAANMTIVVVDDDPLVYKVWQNRFAGLDLERSNIRVLYAKDLKSARKIVLQLEKSSEDYILLIDNELGDTELTGIDFVEQMKIHARSILVTSSGNSNWVYEKCSQIGLAIMPKVIQERIPVEVISS